GGAEPLVVPPGPLDAGRQRRAQPVVQRVVRPGHFLPVHPEPVRREGDAVVPLRVLHDGRIAAPPHVLDNAAHVRRALVVEHLGPRPLQDLPQPLGGHLAQPLDLHAATSPSTPTTGPALRPRPASAPRPPAPPPRGSAGSSG